MRMESVSPQKGVGKPGDVAQLQSACLRVWSGQSSIPRTVQ